MKKILHLSLCLFVTMCFTAKSVDHHVVMQEVERLRSDDYQFKDYVDDSTRYFLGKIDRELTLKEEKSLLTWFGKFLALTRSSNLIMMTEENAPITYNIVSELAEKMEVQMPIIYLARNPELENAFASDTFSIKTLSLLSNMGIKAFGANIIMKFLCQPPSIIILGEKLLKANSFAAVKFVLAHELTHIKNNHTAKQGLATTLWSIGFNALGTGLYAYITNLQSDPYYLTLYAPKKPGPWTQLQLKHNTGETDTTVFNVNRDETSFNVQWDNNEIEPFIVDIAKKAALFIAIKTLVHCGTNVVKGYISRVYEREADLNAARFTEAEAGIEFMQTMNDHTVDLDIDFEYLENEIEAANLGYSPLFKMRVAFWKKWEKLVNWYRRKSIFRSHPTYDERITYLQEFAEQQKTA